MTKPLLITMQEFDLILQGFLDTDKIGRLFSRTQSLMGKMLFNETYTPIFEKNV